MAQDNFPWVTVEPFGTLNDGTTSLTATVSTLNKAATTGKSIAMSIVFGS